LQQRQQQQQQLQQLLLACRVSLAMRVCVPLPPLCALLLQA
jgi:hypothetical protein